MIFKKYLQSIQAKLIINVILIHAVLMGLVVFDLIQREHHFIQKQLSQKGYELASVLSFNAVVPLINNDVVALNELLVDMHKVKDHYMMFILDHQGRVKASTHAKYINQVLDDRHSGVAIHHLMMGQDESYQTVHNNLTDTFDRIVLDGKTIGYARTILDQSSLFDEMNIITNKGLMYVGLAILLGAFFAWLVVRRLTKRLNKVANVAVEISKKNFNVQLPDSKYDDELSKMTEAFSTMIHSINGYVEELKESTRKSQMNEAKLLEAQEIAHLGNWELDIETMMMTWSPEVYRIHGKDPKTFTPTLDNYYLLMDTHSVALIQQNLQKAIETGERVELENKIFLDDGTSKYVYYTAILEKDSKGEPYKLRGVTQDITEDKVKEQHLKEHEAQLLAQSRLAQMGEMISMIAHQWRQPLSSITATAMNHKMMFLLDNVDFDTKQGRELLENESIKAMEDIEKYVEGLSSTIDDFRNFYKPNKVLVNTSLDEIIQKALSLIKLSLDEDKIEIIYEENAGKSIDIFDGEVMQVVLNILKNSQDNFIEKNIQNPSIKIITTTNEITICDNGGGIPDEIFDKIYDPYFSSKIEKNGTGLGLYMSKIIIEEHHKGSLTLENVDAGICCSIKFYKDLL